MKCRFCGEEVSDPVFRKLYPYFNFPTHSRREWSTCYRNIEGTIDDPYKSLFEGLSEIADVTPDIPYEYAGIIKSLSSGYSGQYEGDMAFYKFIDFLKEAAVQKGMPLHGADGVLGKVLNETYPVVRVKDTSAPSATIVQLDPLIYQKLVAYEVKHSLYEAPHLKHVTQEIFHSYQTGKMPIYSPFYETKELPRVKTKQFIYIPADLTEVMSPIWLYNKDKMGLERILYTFANMINVTNQELSTAYSIIHRRITPETVRRRTEKTPKSRRLSYIKVDGLPDNKREAVRDALKYNGPLTTDELGRGTMSSVLVDYADAQRIKELSKELSVPVYKLVTALLLSV